MYKFVLTKDKMLHVLMYTNMFHDESGVLRSNVRAAGYSCYNCLGEDNDVLKLTFSKNSLGYNIGFSLGDEIFVNQCFSDMNFTVGDYRKKEEHNCDSGHIVIDLN